jgi:hypothetical protein
MEVYVRLSHDGFALSLFLKHDFIKEETLYEALQLWERKRERLNFLDF